MDEAYQALINQYKKQVLASIRDQRTALLHSNPTVVMNATITIRQQLANAGGIIHLLARDGYNNSAFYESIGLADRLIDLASQTDDDRVSPSLIRDLEQGISELHSDMQEPSQTLTWKLLNT